MLILKIIALSIGSIIILFILTKLMGNREMSQLTMFDYITSITIGSIAAEMATSLDDNFLEPLVAMIIYGIVAIAIAYATCYSLKFRHFVVGKSLILLDNGSLYRKNFRKAKLDINEFLMQARTKGFFNLSEIQTAILESNGNISFLPVTQKRPVTPQDFNLNPATDNISTNIILDSVVLKNNLRNIGHDELWLKSELQLQGISKPSDVFYASYNNENKLSVYTKIEDDTRDIFY